MSTRVPGHWQPLNIIAAYGQVSSTEKRPGRRRLAGRRGSQLCRDSPRQYRIITLFHCQDYAELCVLVSQLCPVRDDVAATLEKNRSADRMTAARQITAFV